jgi:hypothetical protein
LEQLEMSDQTKVKAREEAMARRILRQELAMTQFYTGNRIEFFDEFTIDDVVAELVSKPEDGGW